MQSDNRLRERRMLALGSVLAVFGTADVLLIFLFGVPDLSEFVIYPSAFVSAIVAGIGTTLCICNLAGAKDA